MAYLLSMNTPSHLHSIESASLKLAETHYENFPVASLMLPKALRLPVAMIYRFARQADDIADEGDASVNERLQSLQAFRDELDLIQAYIRPVTPFFQSLNRTIREWELPLEPFYDLLDAFAQDVVKTRYQNFDEVLDYCRRSANPIGRLMLCLYHASTPENVTDSDLICTALQLINFYQDIAIDYKKNDGKARIYLCQDEMAAFGITENDIVNQTNSPHWQKLMLMNLNRAEQILLSGKPLGRRLNGRIGFELRMMIAGGERILYKLKKTRGGIFEHRPTLRFYDWCWILLKALFKR